MIDLETRRTEQRSNVLVVPFDRPWLGGPDHENAPFHARVLRGQEPKDRFEDRCRDRPAIEKRGRFLYGGPLFDHFGHVMVDAIPRLWAFDRSVHDGVVFPLVRSARPGLPGWVFDILGYLGVARADVHLVEAPTIFETVDFAMPGSILRQGPQDWYLQWLRTRMRPLPESHGEKLYFGRTHMLGSGSVMGESYLSDALQANGFRYVKPELLSIDQQIELASGAGTIVFLEGSSIYITELLAQCRADIFMIPRRNGGDALFGPQLRPRAGSFTAFGASIIRKGNLDGHEKPDSPSYLLNPGNVHDEMRAAGLVSGSFDEPAFRRAEQGDAVSYFNGNESAARAQLAELGLAAS